MTRLSDSLRGLADRAPVDEVGVSTSVATRRIYRGRRLRAAANATAGAGVAAVIALAAIHPGIGSGNALTDSAASGAIPEGAKVNSPELGAADASQLAWGQCGTSPFDAEAPETSDAWALALEGITSEVDPGITLAATLTVTSPTETDAAGFSTPGPAVMVLWNGVVVGTAHNATLDPEVQSTEGGTGQWAAPVDLVNCWDGTPLPGGAYQLVAYQDFYPQTTPPADPTVAPADPTVAPVETTGTPEAPSAADGGISSGSSSESGVAPADTAIVAPGSESPARAISNTIDFTITGEVPEDPFGAYLSPAAPAVVYPDDYLTPSAARDEYAARATTDAWNMAAGTQRVVKSGDSTTAEDQNVWLDSYYGCSADGITTPSFPETSADWPLLKVEATLPRSVGVSYGWVVDGNPKVEVSVSNISGHTLPGFWGEPSTSMYLVKDGKVVATSYLSSTNPNGNVVSPSADGLLAPDGSLSGTYLWRDMNGCWLGTTQATVTPGTYTVLIEQDIYLDNGGSGVGGPIAYVDDAASTGGEAGAGSARVGGTVAPDTAADAPSIIAPAPVDGTYDWLTLQVWTSLGEVTVK